MAAATIGKMIFGSVATFTLGEFVIFILFSAAVIYTLDRIDSRYNLTDKLVKNLRDMAQNAVNKDIEKFKSSVNTAIGMSQLKGNSISW